ECCLFGLARSADTFENDLEVFREFIGAYIPMDVIHNKRSTFEANGLFIGVPHCLVGISKLQLDRWSYRDTLIRERLCGSYLLILDPGIEFLIIVREACDTSWRKTTIGRLQVVR